MEEQKALHFLQGFSIITIGENKVPNFPWKNQQSEKLDQDIFLQRFRYQGGKFRKDGTEIPATKGIGMVTGFEHLECIDVDTKVFSTQLEMDAFWNEYYTTLKDNIISFDDKFVIYKTRSGGYHILYKSKRVQGNTKIASLKGHSEAVIESRGTGGYIFLYPDKKVLESSYFDIDYITDEDRETLWNISRSYNYIDQKPQEPKKEPKIYQDNEVTPWDDFNDKTDIWEVISDDFFIPTGGQKSKHYLIKRHGATSAHSGYVFKDSGCMYLFSTGTIFPAEKLISPFLAYSYKYHNGDMKEASRDLYSQGFGSRLKKEIESIRPEIPEKITVQKAEFPIGIFPTDVQFYLNECSTKLDSNIDFMGVSMMWLISVCVGNLFNIEVKRGWKENGVLWVAVVGKAGIGKTPSISNVIYPIMKMNAKQIKHFIQEQEKYNYYMGLSKKEREDYPEVEQPKKTQFIANDITLEALVELHQESDNAVGVFKDELAGWFKDMNKYRAGSDLEFWLSCWSGKSVSMNRKTAKSSFVDKPFIPVLGGIQPGIFSTFSTEENKDNGFMDRMLLSFPDATVEKYNDSELEYDTIRWYSEVITQFYQKMKAYIIRDEEGEISTLTCRFSPDAKHEWIRIFNKITENQNDDEENEYLKSMYPKQKSYIPRFALLIHIFDCHFNGGDEVTISKESVLKAEMLSDYFVLNAKKIKIESTEIQSIKTMAKNGNTPFEKFRDIYTADPEFNRSKVSELLGVSRKTVYKWIDKIDNKQPEKWN